MGSTDSEFHTHTVGKAYIFQSHMFNRVPRSPSLIPKSSDWADHISVAGFYFLEGHPFHPNQALVSFLEAGPPPIYVFFGSTVVDNPEQLTDIIFEAIRQTSQRTLVSIGWGAIGNNSCPENIFSPRRCSP